jgi:hypothetical protein
VVWLPQDTVHPNGATGIAGLWVSCDAPDAVADSYARLAGVAATASPVPGARRVRIGSVDVDVLTPAALAAALPGVGLADRPGPQVAAIRIAVADIAAAAACLREGGLAPRQLADGSLAVSADLACGVAVVLSGR